MALRQEHAGYGAPGFAPPGGGCTTKPAVGRTRAVGQPSARAGVHQPAHQRGQIRWRRTDHRKGVRCWRPGGLRGARPGPGHPRGGSRAYVRCLRARRSEHRTGSLGVGLFVRRRMADAYGKSIAVTPTPEHGAAFTARPPKGAAAERFHGNEEGLPYGGHGSEGAPEVEACLAEHEPGIENAAAKRATFGALQRPMALAQTPALHARDRLFQRLDGPLPHP